MEGSKRSNRLYHISTPDKHLVGIFRNAKFEDNSFTVLTLGGGSNGSSGQTHPLRLSLCSQRRQTNELRTDGHG